METAQTPPITSTAQKTSEPYSNEMALLLAKMSQLAYVKFEDGESDGLRSKLADLGFSWVADFSKDGTQAFLAKNEKEKTAILAFRGTEIDFKKDFWNAFFDILTDLDATLRQSNTGEVHSGFWDAYCLVKEDIERTLKSLNDYQLFITGHSLGGALAAVSAKFLEDAGFEKQIKAVYSYGAPRVGNDDFGDEIDSPLYRVVDDLDIVPCVPPNRDQIFLFRGLVHLFFKAVAWLMDLSNNTEQPNRAKKAIEKKKVGVSSKCLSIIQSFLDKLDDYCHYGKACYLSPSSPFILEEPKVSLKRSVNDHDISLYIERLEAVQGATINKS